MKKTDWQYVVDTLLFLCIVGIAAIGLFLGLVIPKGPTAQESAKYFLGLHRHQWGNIHFYLSLSFITLVIIHLILSWNWIKGKARQIFKKSWGVMLILTAIVSLSVIVLLWALYPKTPGVYEEYGKRGGRQAMQQQLLEKDPYSPDETIYDKEGNKHIVITGQMTLQEVEKATGIPAGEIASELGIPSTNLPEETLGRLRKKYGFSMEEARDKISDLLNKEAVLHKVKEEKKATQDKPKKDLPRMKEGEKHKGIQTEEHEKKITRGIKSDDTSGILITGRMTLMDIEHETHISARKIAEKLGLPPYAPLNETLGRLRKRYRFTMQEVRDVIAALTKEERER